MGTDMDLSSFVEDDAEEVDESPEIRKKRDVGHPYKNHAIGTLVWVYNRGDEGVEGYFTPRREKKNLFRQYDSYPISVPVMRELVSREVERILVLERETRTVYEYHIEDYLDAPKYEWEHTNDRGEVVRIDEQYCPARADARHTWENVSAADLFPHGTGYR